MNLVYIVEEPSLKVIFFASSVRKNQSKFQKYCFLIGRHSNLDYFLLADTVKK